MIHPLLAGNGPKEIDIREVIEREGTEDRVALGKKIFSPLETSPSPFSEGSVNHDKMRDFLNSGHIFLNTSLTEAFCMAIVEAAACGYERRKERRSLITREIFS